jgi:hypothetical protein
MGLILKFHFAGTPLTQKRFITLTPNQTKENWQNRLVFSLSAISFISDRSQSDQKFNKYLSFSQSTVFPSLKQRTHMMTALGSN